MRASDTAIIGITSLEDRGKQAVTLALAGRWAEAADLNREITGEDPDDVVAHNRLGKALTELGDVPGAVKAFEEALALSPNNAIARKNLQRLASRNPSDRRAAAVATAKKSAGTRRAPVNTEAGKSGVVPLVNLADRAVVSHLSPGDALELVSTDRVVKAVTADGTRIGQVEPRIGARISKLMARGNRYEALIKAVEDGGVTLLIGEAYQHPSQIGVVSFPSAAIGGSGGYGRSGSGSGRRVAPGALARDTDEDRAATGSLSATGPLKDWSNDDTEPGDDEVFSPVVDRMINSSGESDEEF